MLYLLPEIQCFNRDRWCIVTVVGCAGHRTGTGVFGWYVVTGMLSTPSLPQRFCSVQTVSQLLNSDSDFCWWSDDGLWCTQTWPSHLMERWISSKNLLVADETGFLSSRHKMLTCWWEWSSTLSLHLQVWIFDQPDGGVRLLRMREGHSAPPNFLRHYGNNGHNILSAGQWCEGADSNVNVGQ